MIDYKYLTNGELIGLINKGVRIRVFGSTRQKHINSLHNELINRNIDFSCIGDLKCLSLARPVVLVGNQLKFAS